MATSVDENVLANIAIFGFEQISSIANAGDTIKNKNIVTKNFLNYLPQLSELSFYSNRMESIKNWVTNKFSKP